MNALGAASFLLLLVSTLCLAQSVVQHDALRHRVSVDSRRELCPGAVYFYSGPVAPAWAQHKPVVCRIGSHVFLADKT